MIRRDLEDLLNTRQGRKDVPSCFELLSDSLAVYGLNNIDTVDISSKDELLNLLNDIRLTIQRFEPRLENVGVSITKDKDGKEERSPFVLHLRIDADMRIGTYVSQVVFNTMIQKSGATVKEVSDDA